MKVAIVHYWFVGCRGGEKVVEEMCRLFPQADIFTHVVDRDTLTETLKRHRIETTVIGSLPFSKRLYQTYLPLMPWALERLDLTDYDLVLSSEAGPAKGIIPGVTAKHLCYCHSPMRYIWDEHHRYLKEAGAAKRAAFSLAAHYLRSWDVSTCSRVDRFVANSSFVSSRIKRYYGRPSLVVHPPVDLNRFSPKGEGEDFYLWAGQLVGYKRPDIAVDAFRGTNRRLVVAGTGPWGERLAAGAPENVTFLGRVSDRELEDLYHRCRALIFPGQEDFGIVPLEAMASGRPVIAYGKGGVLDSVTHMKTGILFTEQTPMGLRRAIDLYENHAARFDPAAIAATVRGFSAEDFRSRLGRVIEDLLEEDDAEGAAFGGDGSSYPRPALAMPVS